jgi:V/A-type H+/Na+-transporting ATPase subunit I
VIVAMKEVLIVSVRGERAATIERLQDAGVMHVAETAARRDDDVAALRARLGVMRHAADVLSHADRGHGRTHAADDGSDVGSAAQGAHAPLPIADVVDEVERLATRLHDLRVTRTALEHQRERLAPFGSFDPAAIERLRGDGVAVRLAHPPARRALPEVEGATWVTLGARRRQRTLALVGPAAVVDAAEIPDEVALPETSLAHVEREIAAVESSLKRTTARIAELSEARGAVEHALRRTEEDLQFAEARAAMSTVGAVAMLRGFVPEEDVARLRTLAATHGWGMWVSDVQDPAEAPTLIRNPRWARPIAPLFSFLGVVPAYGQVDISVPFLIFFSLFFAMIVGDAGYGALFLILTELGRLRFPAAPGRVIALLRLLSVVTIVWGVASGNVFGMQALPPVLAALRLDWLTQERNVIGLAFAIGAVHLTLAHVWNVVRFVNTTRALAEIGWVATTWTMYFLARQLVLGDPFPRFVWIVFAAGVVLIALFTTPWRRLRSEWFQHAVLPLSLVNNFVDVVSYVRLFAVGAATYAVAGAFNELATGLGLTGPVGGVLTALVLFFGHTLNVLLAAMGVLVHGVRLNTLEFAGHLGLPWTGHPYRPLARSAPRGTEGDPSWTPR